VLALEGKAATVLLPKPQNNAPPRPINMIARAMATVRSREPGRQRDLLDVFVERMMRRSWGFRFLYSTFGAAYNISESTAGALKHS
jgi:hypothetical protein